MYDVCNSVNVLDWTVRIPMWFLFQDDFLDYEKVTVSAKKAVALA